MATSRRKPAIPPLRTLELRELQQVIANIRERLDQLDAAVSSAGASTASTTSATTASSASSAETADAADALTTARAFDLAGVTTDGPHTFDGTADVTIEVLEIPLALLEQDGATSAQVLAWDGSGGWTPTTLLDPLGPIDHGALLGLADDDHPHYLNEARANALYSALGHAHDLADVTGLVAALAAKLTSPLQDYGDMITGQSAGSPARLPIGFEGQVLRVVSGLPAWDDEAAGGGGMANPMTDIGDLIFGQSAGSPARIPIGADGEVLTVVAGVPEWQAAAGSDGWTYVTLGSDYTNATSSLTNVTGLKFDIPEAGTFEFEGKLIIQTSITTSQPQVSATEPNNASGAWIMYTTQNGTSGFTCTGGTGRTGGITAAGTTVGANIPLLVQIDGLYVATAASTSPWQLQARSETNLQTTTIKAGSFIRWRKLP